jgi:hypothetical protein
MSEDLERDLGLVPVVAVNSGAMIGSGIVVSLGYPKPRSTEGREFLPLAPLSRSY